MPGYLDVYVLAPERSPAVLKRFLEAFVDGVASSDRSGEELMMLPVGYTGPTDAQDTGWEWRPVETLEEALSIGLGPPARAFSLYLKARRSGTHHPVITFTRDDALVFGISVDEEDEDSVGRAQALLREMAEHLGASLGFVAAEEPPPLDADAFRRAGARPHVLARVGFAAA